MVQDGTSPLIACGTSPPAEGRDPVPATPHDPRPWNRRPPRTTPGPLVTPTRQNHSPATPTTTTLPTSATRWKIRA